MGAGSLLIPGPEPEGDPWEGFPSEGVHESKNSGFLEPVQAVGFHFLNASNEEKPTSFP